MARDLWYEIGGRRVTSDDGRKSMARWWHDQTRRHGHRPVITISCEEGNKIREKYKPMVQFR